MKPLHLKDSPLSSRPRERLIANGAEALQTRELFMTILGNGTHNFPVQQIAGKLAQVFEHVAIEEITLERLMNIRGVGRSKACSLLAMLELSTRLKLRQELSFKTPSVVWTFLQHYAESHKEHLLCLYLNARYQLVHKEVLAVGSLNQLMIFPRDVFTPIKHYPVATIILAHNHPSGDPTPSVDDIEFTKKMMEAANLLGIELADHVVIAKNTWHSLREHREVVFNCDQTLP